MEGWRVAQAETAQGVSRNTPYQWSRRLRQEELEGLVDRSSTPHSAAARIATGPNIGLSELYYHAYSAARRDK